MYVYLCVRAHTDAHARGRCITGRYTPIIHHLIYIYIYMYIYIWIYISRGGIHLSEIISHTDIYIHEYTYHGDVYIYHRLCHVYTYICEYKYHGEVYIYLRSSHVYIYIWIWHTSSHVYIYEYTYLYMNIHMTGRYTSIIDLWGDIRHICRDVTEITSHLQKRRPHDRCDLYQRYDISFAKETSR